MHSQIVELLGAPPTVATQKPKVMYEVENVTGSSKQELIFKCDFPRVADASVLFYKVFWFINDYKSAIFISKAVEFHQLDTAYLKGSTGLENIKLGVKVYNSNELHRSSLYDFDSYCHKTNYIVLFTVDRRKRVARDPYVV